MNIDFTSQANVEKAVKQRISELKDDEKEEMIQKARKEDKFNLQIGRSDDEMLKIYVKYQLFNDQLDD